MENVRKLGGNVRGKFTFQMSFVKQNELVSKVNEYRKLASFKFGGASESQSAKMYRTYEKNSLFLRGIFYLEMFNADSTGFFDIPTVPELFTTIYSKPRKAISKFRPMFIQSFTYHVCNIYKAPKEFARNVASYISDDPTFHLFFAYSTFPAIFGFFASQELCELGSIFLIELIQNTDEEFVADAFLAAFFCALPDFYNYFFSTFSENVNEFSLCTSFDEFYRKFIPLIKQAMPLIPIPFIKVLNEMVKKYKKSAAEFFVDSFFYDHFIALRSSTGYFTQPEVCTALEGFFVEMKEKKANEVVDYIIGNAIFQNEFPSLTGVLSQSGLPLFLSERDIELVVDSLLYGTNNIINQAPNTYSNSLNPLILIIYPDFLYETSKYEGIGRCLFDIQPEDVEIEENEDFERIYRRVKKLSENESGDVIDFIEKSNNKSIKRQSIIDFIYKSVNNECVRNFKKLELDIHNSEVRNRHKMYGESCREYMTYLFHRFSFDFLQKSISDAKGSNLFSKVDSAISSVSSGVSYVPGSAIFALSCTALDTIAISYKGMIEVDSAFQNLLDKWVENNWEKFPGKEFIKPKIIYLMSAALKLSHIGEIGFGKRLKLIIDFEKSLRSILGFYYDKYWVGTFAFSIFVAKEPNILATFLLFHHFVIEENFAGRWGKEIIDNWQMFSAGMWYLLKNDRELFLKCSDKERSAKIFGLH